MRAIVAHRYTPESDMMRTLRRGNDEPVRPYWEADVNFNFTILDFRLVGLVEVFHAFT